MKLHLFGNHSPESRTEIVVPAGYRSTARWQPHLGDIFPDFTADSTHGVIHFHPWAEGSWVYLFSHPAAFTPVCSTELADVASRADDLAARGVKAITISRDRLDDQRDWAEDLEKVFGSPMNFPLVSDPDGVIAGACGMVHPHEDALLPIRRAFILDPALKIRLILDYPMNIGRDIEEVLRVIDALQASDAEDLAAPAAWMPGDPMLVRATTTDSEAKLRYGDRLQRLRPYLRMVRPRKEP
jgi:peroxiredoxin (alkyl hydroperoxide reductase subunit C)